MKITIIPHPQVEIVTTTIKNEEIMGKVGEASTPRPSKDQGTQ